MGQTVQEFIQAAQAKEREEFERKRDLHLIKLGLVDDSKTVTSYSKYQTSIHTYWDSEKQMYFAKTAAPLSVSDEEYEEIKRLTQHKTETPTLNDSAETFLNVVLIISLIVGILGAMILFVAGAETYRGGEVYFISGGVLLVSSIINFAIGKVVLNISNNLHMLNYKVKKMK